jgi:hypothetical protein
MSFLPKDEHEPPRDGANGTGKRPGPSRNRIIFWVVGAGVGVYMVASGVIGALAK